MNVPSCSHAEASLPPLEFESLELFPCGCVALVQRTRPWPVTVVSIEAKGPHCLFVQHRPGKVVRLGEVWESAAADDDVEEEEEEERAQR